MPGSSRFAIPTRVARRRELDRGGDAEIPERLLAEVPAHRPGDLADEAGHDLTASGTAVPSALDSSSDSGSAAVNGAAYARRASSAGAM